MRRRHGRSAAAGGERRARLLNLRFGGVPTVTEGMMYPVPYADIDAAVRLAVTAEQLGFESVWGNDHITTQRYVRAEFGTPPRFWDPLTYLSFVTARNRQATTLDHLSGGRLVLGVPPYRQFRS